MTNLSTFGHSRRCSLDSLELARKIVDIIADKKGEKVVLLDIRDVSILADYFVIASTTSERQAQALVEAAREEAKKALDARPLHVEGKPASGWVLMDYGGVVVHLFAPEVRAYYDLEGLWKQGRVVVRML
jgi:ribosome-associated protein